MSSDQSPPDAGRDPIADPYSVPPGGSYPPPAWEQPHHVPYHPWAGPPPSGRPPRHTSGVLALATILAFVGGLLVGGVAVGVVWAVRSGSGEPSYEPAADMLPVELPRLIEFVERERELAFLEDVDIEVVDDDDFERALLVPVPEREGSGPLDHGSTYAALGMTPDAATYYNGEFSAYTEYLVGFYDPEHTQMLIRGTDWTPDVEATVVHELVHALQDQHFDIAAQLEDRDEDDEAALALRSIIEGDAARVEYAYIDEQDAQWQEAYDNAYLEAKPTGIYDPMADFVGWLPYWLGTTAVETLVEIGGNGVMNDGLRGPPTTSEQLLEIAEWHSGEEELRPAVDVEPPDVNGGAVLDRGTLGVAKISVLPLTF